VVRIAWPLTYIPALRVLIQGALNQEQTLAEAIRIACIAGGAAARAVLTPVLEQTAAGLAALHRCNVDYGRHVAISDVLSEVRALIGELAVAVPCLTDAAEPLLRRIEQLDAACPPDPAVPTHRSFRPAQVLLGQHQIGFVDFDGLCQAKPALDVALFRAAVNYTGLARYRRGGIPPDPVIQSAKLNELQQLGEIFSAPTKRWCRSHLPESWSGKPFICSPTFCIAGQKSARTACSPP
jgi:hypothetical protein